MIDQIYIFYDEKEGYDKYIELAHKAWKFIFPTTKITVLYVEGTKPNVSDLIHLQELPYIPDVSASFALNVYKFLYPTTLYNDNTVLLTTHKTIPLNTKYFLEKLKLIDENKITSILTNLDENNQPFNYWIGKPYIWRKLFNITDITTFTQGLFKHNLSYNSLYKEINKDYLICINDLYMNNVKQMMRLTNKEFETFNGIYQPLTSARRDEVFKKAMKISIQDNHYIDFIVSSKYVKYSDYINYIFELLERNNGFLNGSSGLRIINDNSPLMII